MFFSSGDLVKLGAVYQGGHLNYNQVESLHWSRWKWSSSTHKTDNAGQDKICWGKPWLVVWLLTVIMGDCGRLCQGQARSFKATALCNIRREAPLYSLIKRQASRSTYYDATRNDFWWMPWQRQPAWLSRGEQETSVRVNVVFCRTWLCDWSKYLICKPLNCSKP